MIQPIRILDLRDSPWVDGPGRTVIETAQAMDQNRFKVVIGGFCNENASENDYLSEARRRSLDVRPIFETKAVDLNVIRQIHAAIDEHRIDIVHTHDFRSNLLGLYCARRRKLPVISSCHGWIANNLKGSIYRYVDIKLLSRSDRVVTVSDAMKTQLIAKGFPARKVVVIVNALITGDFDPAPDDLRFRHELGIDRATGLFLNIGRLSAEKGQAILLKAIARVWEQERDIRLVFVGIGSEEDVLRAKVAELGLDDIVIFSGYRTDMARIYNSADLVIQSSLTEGMPNVILESLLMHTPVVATDVGGTREIVQHGVTGYLVAPNSDKQLAHGILDFILRKSNHNEMARRGRKIVSKNFNHDTRVRQISSLYSSIVTNGTC